MSPDKVKTVVAKYQLLLDEKFGTSEERNMEATDLRARLNHLDWMCGQIYGFVDEGRMDKAFRWLGFLQGAFWAYGIQGIEESKQDNTPEGVQFDRNKV